MKYLLILLIALSFSVQATETQCHEFSLPIIERDYKNNIQKIHDVLKREFKRRPINVNGLQLALNIETNFEAPLIGNDIYWGRIFFKDYDESNIAYRDDLIAESKYNREKQNPGTVNYSNYKVAEINSANGLYLVKAAGAEVNVKAVAANFSTKAGGRLSIRVKAPKEPPVLITIDVERTPKGINKFLIVNNKRLPFDSFKINASKNVITGTSILNGIDNIQFFSQGNLTHTITQ
jgi:hypothetical protein